MYAIGVFFRTISVYRLTLWFLVLMLGLGAALSVAGVLHYRPQDILLQAIVFVAICWVANALAAYVLKIRTKTESAVITGLILGCIMGPLALEKEWLVVVVAAVAAIGSKYLIAMRGRHIFNPAACGVIASALLLVYPASWWVGSPILTPVIAAGGLLVAYKIRRLHLVTAFMGVFMMLRLLDTLLVQSSFFESAYQLFSSLLAASPLFFFACIMLIEPMSAPQARKLGVLFGGLVGTALFFLQRFASDISFSLELSLLIGNVFAFLVGPGMRSFLGFGISSRN